MPLITPRFWPACVLGALTLTSISAAADWGTCAASRDLAQEFDLDGVRDIAIEAVAGELDIKGVSDPARVVAKGRACATMRYRDDIDEIKIVSERDGSTLRIIASVPQTSNQNSLIGQLDMTLTLPDDLPVSVIDSSGDTRIKGTGSLNIKDSSGDLDIKRINGDVTIDVDSSGDLSIREAGNVVIRIDSSGDIRINDVLSVQIGKDSSGDIEASEVAGDVYVGADSSGDIDVSDVGGSFTVARDGSGGIDYQSVSGQVSIPKSKRDR